MLLVSYDQVPILIPMHPHSKVSVSTNEQHHAYARFRDGLPPLDDDNKMDWFLPNDASKSWVHLLSSPNIHHWERFRDFSDHDRHLVLWRLAYRKHAKSNAEEVKRIAWWDTPMPLLHLASDVSWHPMVKKPCAGWMRWVLNETVKHIPDPYQETHRWQLWRALFWKGRWDCMKSLADCLPASLHENPSASTVGLDMTDWGQIAAAFKFVNIHQRECWLEYLIDRVGRPFSTSGAQSFFSIAEPLPEYLQKRLFLKLNSRFSSWIENAPQSSYLLHTPWTRRQFFERTAIPCANTAQAPRCAAVLLAILHQEEGDHFRAQEEKQLRLTAEVYRTSHVPAAIKNSEKHKTLPNSGQKPIDEQRKRWV